VFERGEEGVRFGADHFVEDGGEDAAWVVVWGSGGRVVVVGGGRVGSVASRSMQLTTLRTESDGLDSSRKSVQCERVVVEWWG